MIYWFNELAAIVALPILLLGLRGFLPHVWRQRKAIIRGAGWSDRSLLMSLAVIGMDIKGILRMGYWDLYRPVMRVFTDQPAIQSLHGTLVNGSINLFAAAIGLCCLRVLYLSIPESRRKDYSIWTAAFFPIKSRERLF